MKIQPYRKIVKADGRITQKDLFGEFISRVRSPVDIPAGVGSDSPISDELVPRLVNPRQFEAICMRRRVRSCIEKARIDVGIPADGSRTGGYKYLKRHVVASNRARDHNGLFTKICNVPSICN